MMFLKLCQSLYRDVKSIHKICGCTCSKNLHLVRNAASNTNLQNNTPNTVDRKNVRELVLRFIYVKSCVDYWVEYPTGVIFDSAYLDSHPAVGFNPDTPVLVALHDSPGSSKDLVPLLQPFANLGYRVIVPDFPGFGSTKGIDSRDNFIFTGKTEERSDFILNFLETLGIKRVDLLIGYGSGCNTAVSYTASTFRKFNIVKSLALINPPGHRHKSPSDYNSIEEFAALWDDKPYLRIPLRLTLEHAALTRLKFLRQYQFRDRLKAMLHFSGFQYDVVCSDSVEIGFTNIPRILVYSKNSIFYDEEIMQEYADNLGIPSSNFCHYGNDGKLTTPEKNTSTLKGLVIEEEEEEGSVIQKYTGQLILLLQDLLKNVIK